MVAVNGIGQAILDEPIAHEGFRADVRVHRVTAHSDEVSVDEFVVAVLAVAAQGEGLLDVGPLVEGAGGREAEDAHARLEVLIAVIVAVDVALGAGLVTDEDVHTAGAAQPPNRQRSACLCGKKQPEAAILVLRHGARPDVNAERGEDHSSRIAVVDQQARPLVFVQRPFGQHFGAQKPQLSTAMPSILVAVAKFQVENGSGAVPELRRESGREEVGIRQGFVVDDGHWPTAGAGDREVVRIREVHAFNTPKHTVRAVAPDDDVVAGVVGALHAREVAGHPRGVPARAGVAIRFFNGECPGADGCHLVHHLTRATCRDLGSLHGHDALLQVDVQHQRAPAVEDQTIEHPRLISHERDPQHVAPDRHLIEHEMAVCVA